jgi:antitoxin component of MazEF toxin-antitoxin module
MDIHLKRWGNNIGIPIPQKIAENFGINENWHWFSVIVRLKP